MILGEETYKKSNTKREFNLQRKLFQNFSKLQTQDHLKKVPRLRMEIDSHGQLSFHRIVNDCNQCYVVLYREIVMEKPGL